MSNPNPNRADTVQVIVTDIEGTTTATSFVYGSLFPYIRQNLHHFLTKNETDEEVDGILSQVRNLIGNSTATLEHLASVIIGWMDKDLKINPLKQLQGLMWEDGYKTKSYEGHVYDDAFQQMKKWKSEGLDLYVYSSGSVKAQQLLFGNTCFGNITHLFSGYFDSAMGDKKEFLSYSKIQTEIGKPLKNILFISDSLAELDAAQHAGMQTTLVCRDTLGPTNCQHTVVKEFYEIFL